MSEWQPIESVPTGPQTKVLAWSSVYGEPVVCQVSSDGSCWEGDWDYDVRATHWMPLPDPPQ